jgi:hypothetical protein
MRINFKIINCLCRFQLGIFGIAAMALPYADTIWAQVDPNVELSFSKIYVTEPQDTVDGAFKDVTLQAIQEVFAVNPRFRRATEVEGADGVLAVEISKNGDEFLVRCKLILASSGEVFAMEEQSASGEDELSLRRKISLSVKTALSRIPFYGAVTGRDRDQITLDIGSYQGVGVGDTVQISRVDTIKRHPLLKQIIDVRLAPVGTALVEEVEEGLSFGRVVQELPGEKVLKYHKISGIQRAPKINEEGPLSVDGKNRDQSVDSYLPHVRASDENSKLAQYGYVSLDLRVDSFTHSATRNGVTVSGGGFNPGFVLRGEAWFTSRIFADLSLGGSFMSYGIDSNSGVTQKSLSTSTRTVGFNVGYRFLFDQSIYGPQLAAKVGYSHYKWQVSTSANDFLTPRTYKGLNIGLMGTMPFGKKPYGAMLDVGMLLFPSLSESTEVIGTDGSSTVARLYVGGYYYINPRLSFRAGLHFESYSTDFEGATTGSTTQKNIGFAPSVQYYF